MDSLLVGIPHSIDCDGALDASSMLTCETPPSSRSRPFDSGGRLRQNGGRHQFRMPDGISSQCWTPSAQNAWTACLRIRTYMAPEQYTKDLIEDGSRMDVFALAVIAFECLTDGLHPIGVRTSDVWPVPLPDKPSKWSHEDIWKSWGAPCKDGIVRLPIQSWADCIAGLDCHVTFS